MSFHVTVTEAVSPDNYTYVWTVQDTDFDFDTFEAKYRHMYTDARRFYIVADGSMVLHLDADKLERLINLLQELRPMTGKQVIGSAIIITNAIMHAVVSCVMSKYTHVSPMQIVKSSSEALLFLQSLPK